MVIKNKGNYSFLVNNAYGCVVDCEGPWTLRRNDLALLRISNINERFRELQEDLAPEDQTVTFGDSAYKKQSHIRTYLSEGEVVGARAVEYRKAFNGCSKKIRISIEWDYGTTASLFMYLQNLDKLKLMKSENVKKIYIVCTLLKNFHVMLYGCQSSNYFNIQFPPNTLEHYINQTDLPN